MRQSAGRSVRREINRSINNGGLLSGNWCLWVYPFVAFWFIGIFIKLCRYIFLKDIEYSNIEVIEVRARVLHRIRYKFGKH